MANNFVRPGHTKTHTLVSTGQTVGTGRLIGSLFGIALTTGIAGDTIEFQLDGVWTLTAVSGDTPADGAKAYWDNTAKTVTTTTTSNTLIGVFDKAKASGVLVADVRLNGVSV